MEALWEKRIKETEISRWRDMDVVAAIKEMGDKVTTARS
jgi:hypothetical protein